MKVIDNFLPEDQHQAIWNYFMGDSVPWFYSSGVARDQVKEGRYFYMTHYLYRDYQPVSPGIEVCNPISKKLNVKALLRIKANLYPNQGDHIHIHDAHKDYTFSHRAAIYSVNTCNGGTQIGTDFIESKANRILLFDGSIPHSSSTCTDEQVRVNIGFNYIDETCLI